MELEVEPRGPCVALAEDNPDTLDLMVRLLKRLGYCVVCAASNGAELIEQCIDLVVDVVLVDLDMPLVDGLEAAEEFSRRGVPVVLITGMPDSEHLVVEKEPIVVRLAKPATAESIRGAIDLALASAAGSDSN